VIGWWQRFSLRGRLILIGVFGLVVGLGLGGGLLYYSVSISLHRTLDSSATQSARDVAALEIANRLPDPIPAGSGTSVIQVVDAQDRIVAASASADRLVPMLDPGQLKVGRAGRHLTVSGDRAGLSGVLRVAAAPAGDRTVLVAVPASELDATVRVVRNVLLIAYPLLVALLALLAWRVVGWTLRPVEALRRGAESITGSGSTADRLPVPPGRDEVARLAETLNLMLARLQAGQVRQRAFVADAAHELRSPVASIRTQLEVAQHLGDRADWPEVARDVLADTERLSRLTEDLLLLARVADPEDATSRLARHRARVDVAELVGEVAERYAGARVPVTVARAEGGAEGGAVHVDADPTALARVLANLVDNAVRHATTEVVLSWRRDGDDAVLAVADDGPGIPVPDRERVFDRFTRLDDGRARDPEGTDAGGSGLGLAIVRELVRLHGGTVTLAAAHSLNVNTRGRGGPGVRAEVVLPATA
jgi:signal transduction histidine kinase